MVNPLPRLPTDPVAVTLEAWRQRGEGWKQQEGWDHTPLFEIYCAVLSLELNNLDDLGKVCRLAARIVAPDIDISQMRFPHHNMLREYIIKLDMLEMKHQREFWAQGDLRVAHFLTPDSSPQGQWDFLNTIEELMVRKVPIVVPTNPFGGFDWVRRTCPIMTMARGESNSAVKLDRVSTQGMLEAGSASLGKWRACARGFCSDQGGSEVAVPLAPFSSNGEAFLPKALRNNDIWHILFNAAQRVIEALPEHYATLQLKRK